jgi:Protein of unknown function (DUF3592)
MSTVDRTLDAVGKGASRLQVGCWIIFANLFFAGFCLWGVYAGYISWKLENEGITTTGMVVRLEESDSAEGGCCVYSPVIEFTASDDQKYSFEGDTASDPPAYDVGEQVNVIYDPKDPDTAQINKILIIPIMTITALIVNFVLLRMLWRGEAVDEG